MRFLGSKFTQNALAAGVPPRTPLGELERSPRPPSRFQGAASRQGKGKGGEIERRRGGESGKGVMGKGKREGREEGREGQGRGTEGGVCVIGVGGIDAPGRYHSDMP